MRENNDERCVEQLDDKNKVFHFKPEVWYANLDLRLRDNLIVLSCEHLKEKILHFFLQQFH